MVITKGARIIQFLFHIFFEKNYSVLENSDDGHSNDAFDNDNNLTASLVPAELRKFKKIHLPKFLLKLASHIK